MANASSITEFDAAVASAPVQVDRTDDATQVAGFITRPGSRIRVLYGKRASGKTELVRRWVLPILASDHRVYYGRCNPDLPRRFSTDRGEVAIEWQSLPRGILIVDDFDRLLSQPDRSRRGQIEKILSAHRESATQPLLIFVMDEDDLRSLLALRPIAPELLEEMLELPEVSPEMGLTNLASVRSETGPAYAPEVLKAVAEDLSHFRTSMATPLLIQVVDAALASYATATDHDTILPVHYKNFGGLKGILDDYLRQRLDELDGALNAGARELGVALLAHVASGETVSPSDLHQIATRMDVTEDRVTAVLEWLRGPQGLLRGKSCGFQFQPPQLAQIVAEQSAFEERELRPLERAVPEWVRSWSELGSVIGKERFEELHRQRKRLRVSPLEASFFAHCALRHSADLAVAQYWLARIPERRQQNTAVVRGLLANESEVRVRAAELACKYEGAEVMHQLYRMAVEDPDTNSREAAISALSKLGANALRERLEEEACDSANPYQCNAIAALRIFPDGGAAAVLKQLVNNPESALEIRFRAIGTLGELRVPEAMDALVDISLNDSEAEDRSKAAEALRSIESASLQASAIARVRDTPIQLEAGALNTWKYWGSRFGALITAIGVTIANFMLHGFALLSLRRYKLALVFFAIQIAVFAAFELSVEFFVTAFGLNLMASQIAAFRVAREESEARSRFERALRSVLFLASIPLLAICFQGIGHIVIGRVRRGLVIFGVQVLGLLCFAVLFFCPEVANSAPLSSVGQRIMHNVYLYLGVLLLGGAYLFDVGLSGWMTLRPKPLMEADERRQKVYRSMLGNPSAAGSVVVDLESPNSRSRRWAKRMILRYVDAIPAQVLITQLRPHAPSGIVRALEYKKDDASVSALASLWEESSDPALRNRIVRILAANPNENSLNHLRRMFRALGMGSRIRYVLSALDYRIRLWPRPMLALIGCLFPLALAMSYEGSAAMWDESRPLVRALRRRTSELIDPPLFSVSKANPVRIASEADFLIKHYGFNAIQNIVEVFDYVETHPAKSQHAELWDGLLGSIESAALSNDPQIAAAALNAIEKGLKKSINNDETLRRSQSLVTIAQNAGTQDAKNRARDLLSSKAEFYGRILTDDSDDSRKDTARASLEAAASQAALNVLAELVRKPPVLGSVRGGFQTARRKSGEVGGVWEGIRKQQKDALASISSIGTAEARNELIALRHNGLPSELDKEAGSLLRRMPGDRASEARAALSKRRFEEALAIVDEIIESGVKEAKIFAIGGEAAYRLSTSSTADKAQVPKLQEKAVDYLERARSLEPADASSAVLLASALNSRAQLLVDAEGSGLKENQQALVYVERALKADATNADAHSLRGRILLTLGEAGNGMRRAEYRRLADASFARSIQLAPEFSWARFMQAMIAYEDGHYQRATELVRAAIDKDPSYSYHYSLLRRIYIDWGKVDEALQVFEDLRKRHPEYIFPAVELAVTYHDNIGPRDPMGPEHAYQILTSGRSMARGDEDFESNFVEANFTTGRYAQAVKLAEALADRTNQGERKVTMGMIAYAALVADGNYAGAAQKLQTVLKARQRLGDKYVADWIYDGTLSHLKRSNIPEPAKSTVISLIDTVNTCNKNIRKQPNLKQPPCEALPKDLVRQGVQALTRMSSRQSASLE